MSDGTSFFRAEVDALAPYATGRPLEDLQVELGLDRVVKLAANEGPFPPFPGAIAAMEAAEPALNRYPNGGAVRLHEALAARHGVGVEQVSAGSGADGCIDNLSQAVLGPGDEIVCAWPTFPSYEIYAAKQGAVTTRAPLRDHRHDLDALLAAIGPRTKLVYVCNPNNPTATMNTASELARFLDRVPEGVLPVVDQAYFEYVRQPGYPDVIAEHVLAGRRVVVLRTFSKIYGLAGLRVGYAVGPLDVCAAMAKVRRPFDISTTAQVAALASLDDPVELDRRRVLNASGLAELTEILGRHGLEPVPGAVANFVYVELPDDAAALFERLLEHGVLVRPLAAFGAPNAIRVSVGTPEEHAYLDEALGRALS